MVLYYNFAAGSFHTKKLLDIGAKPNPSTYNLASVTHPLKIADSTHASHGFSAIAELLVYVY